ENPLKLESRPKLDLSMANFPQKTRKRHKVATSCNRCRQNKVGYASLVERHIYSTLTRNLKQSRSTWGDSPLSREKVVGVSTADMAGVESAPVVSTDTVAQGSGTQAAAKGASKPSSKKASASKKGFTAGTSNILASSPQAASLSFTSTTSTSLFNPGHASTEQTSALDRRKEMLAAQSKQIAKAIRIAKPGPQLDLSDVIAPGNSSSVLNVQSTRKEHSNYPPRGLESSNLNVTQSAALDHAGRSFVSTPIQPTTKGVFQQVMLTLQPLSSSPHQIQHAFQAQQVRQGSSDGLTANPVRYTSSYSEQPQQQQRISLSGRNEDGKYQSAPGFSNSSGNRPIPTQQQFPLSYPANEAIGDFTKLSTLVPSQGDFSMITHGYPDGGTTTTSGGEATGALHSSSGLQVTSTGLGNPPSVQRPNQGSLSQASTLQQQTPHRHHAISSAAPTLSIGVTSQFSSQAAWGAPAQQLYGHVEWNSISHQPMGHSDQCITNPQPASHPQQQQQSTHTQVLSPPPVAVATVASVPATLQSITSPVSPVNELVEMRMRRIAKHILDCKAYDHSIMLPRHISQESDEFWVTSQPTTPSDLQRIPRQLLMLPKDANFLADVFFEVHVEIQLMEPYTPQALFMLNIVFMAACKHLGRSTDIKRAIQFRERARDSKVRISRMQTTLLGSQVIYGVFSPVIGLSQTCGTYRSLPTLDNTVAADENESMIDLAAESRSIAAHKGIIPEAAYQQRLWTFWGFCVRDAMARLYFGWPHGIDNMVVTAELPEIKGYVGLGGMRKNLTDHSGLDATPTGKRRGPVITKKQTQREKKLLKAEAAAKQTGRDMYRMASSVSDDDDEDDDEVEDQEDGSDLEQDEITATSMDRQNEERMMEGDKRFRRPFGIANSQSNTEKPTKDKTPSFSGLSKQLLERQSRGEDITRRQGTSGSGPHSAQVRRHLDRMKLLLDAEEDITDGGTYARILFLEEIKLWSIGRRVGLYLQSRNTFLTVSPAGAATGSFSPYDKHGSAADSQDSFTSTFSASAEAGRCSESVWRDDKELQRLQADLIAWEQALPPMFRFCQDVKQPGIVHKVNGRLSILSMYYYTITIMLQSSYLPIPQYLLSSSRSSATKSPESISQEYEGLFSRAASMASSSEDGGSRIKSEAEEYFHTGRSPPPSSNGYFNTAHQICTELSNVLYHHIELMLDSYTDWCSIQVKLNQSLTAALRVSCLNARLSSNSKAIRDEGKAGFQMGTELYKRQALLPAPLTVRDWPAEEDVNVMLGLEEGFREMMTTQEEEQAMAEARSRSQTRDDSVGVGQHGEPGDHLLYTPDLQDGGHIGLAFDDPSADQSQYDIFSLYENFQFSYTTDA
ncbi:hypothetical protein BGZ65_004169, partial [Modicella reniformis]